jgi:hypothetical protein
MFLRTLLLALGAIALGSTESFAAPTIQAADAAPVGSELTVTVTGNANPRDFVTIVAKAAKEGSYETYAYLDKGGTFKLVLPSAPGDYEVRVLSAASPYPTLARRSIKLQAASATLDAPAQVAAGAKFQVKWTGPKNARDYIGIGDAKRPYVTYLYTNQGNPLTFTAPDEAGSYELRYFLGSGDAVIASRPIVIGSVAATVSAPASVGVGANLKVSWQGPNNPRDFITIVKVGTPPGRYDDYVYTSAGNPVQLRAPEQPGDYEVRYLTGQSYATLGTTRLTVTAASATLKGPATAVAGSTFQVAWTGPNNARDFINLVPKGAREGASTAWAYTAQGNPAQMRAPVTPGEYELRYSLGHSYTTLVSAPIVITPGKEEPGLVVVSSGSAATSDNAVEIILDASGSMLQRIGSQRRIDIARQTLTKLTSATIPAGTPFALRVFGREVSSCQTDLYIPLKPLDVAAVGAQIGKLEAKNGARTPIGASLAKVTEDLASVKGERLVVLLTDGEETCDGDPAAEIEKLQKGALPVRVNIVGFAIDDAKLGLTFKRWAEAGNGAYFEANDAAGLNSALTQAMRPGFDVLDAKGQVLAEGIVDGEPVKVMPGSYTVRLKGRKSNPQSVTVKQKETSTVRF